MNNDWKNHHFQNFGIFRRMSRISYNKSREYLAGSINLDDETLLKHLQTVHGMFKLSSLRFQLVVQSDFLHV